MTSLPQDLQDRYDEDGFAIWRGAIDPAIVAPLSTAVGHEALVVLDQAGNRQEVNTWTWCGDDLVGRLPRYELFVDLAALLIGEPVHHWHSKISWKRPGTEGTWDWHQDYAFWLEEGCDRPAMATVSVAIDRNDTENGCLKLIRGSHRLGNIDHPAVGSGRAIDPLLLAEIFASHEVVDIELEPGDLVAFHCNTIHGSGPNRSDRMRTLFHASYNARSNGATRPFIEGHQVHDLTPVALDAIRPSAYRSTFGETAFIRPENTGYHGRFGYQVLAANETSSP